MLKPFWDFIKESSPEQKIRASFETPAISGAGIVSKTIYKGVGIGGLLAGTVIGAFLFGGKGQDVKPTQTTKVTPKQQLDQEQRQAQWGRFFSRIGELTAAQRQKVQVEGAPQTIGGTTITGGAGALTYSPYTYQLEQQITGVSQEQLAGIIQSMAQAQAQQAAPQQTVTVTPTQETSAAQMDMSGILILGAIVAAAYVLTKKR